MTIAVHAFSDAPFAFRRAAMRADADPPTRCRRPNAEYRDDDLLGYAARHTIIMERARGPFDKTAGGNRHSPFGIKVGAVIYPPCPR